MKIVETPPTAPRMPDPIAQGSMIPTLDRQGAVWLFVDEVTSKYLDAVPGRTALEIAAGYGHMVVSALERGARRIWANEIDAGQLAIIQSRTPAKYRDRLDCYLGAFPEAVDFEASSLDCIYSARLFHFFDAEQIRSGLRKVHTWLRPDGEVFLVNDAVYRSVFKPLIPLYEQRIAAGDVWPGHFANVRSCIPPALNPEQFPKTMNFLDPAVLERELSRAGFEVVSAGFYPYTGSFEPGRLDGREIVGVVARRI